MSNFTIDNIGDDMFDIRDVIDMKKLLPLISLTLLASCASLPPIVKTTHIGMPEGMTYREDIKDSWDVGCPAFGDCDDAVLCESLRNKQKDNSQSFGYLVITNDYYHSNSIYHAVFMADNGDVKDIQGIKYSAQQLINSPACDLTSGKSGRLNSEGVFIPFSDDIQTKEIKRGDAFYIKCMKAASDLNKAMVKGK